MPDPLRLIRPTNKSYKVLRPCLPHLSIPTYLAFAPARHEPFPPFMKNTEVGVKNIVPDMEGFCRLGAVELFKAGIPDQNVDLVGF